MYLNCPACTQLLHKQQFSEIAAHVCSVGCGGIWLKEADVQQLVHTPRLVDKMLAATASTTPMRHGQARKCPECGKGLTARLVRGEAEVEIDLCGSCQGIWLDQGEVATLVWLRRKGQAHPNHDHAVSHKPHSRSKLDDVADVFLYAPDATYVAADLTAEAVNVAVDVVPDAIAGAPEAIVSVTDVVGAGLVEGVGEVAGATANLAGEAIGGLFELLGGLFS